MKPEDASASPPPAKKTSARYNRSAIRKFIREHFSISEFRRFCDDYFKGATAEFPDTVGITELAEIFIGWLSRHTADGLERLLAALKEKRPENYAQWEERLRSAADDSAVKQIQEGLRAFPDLMPDAPIEMPVAAAEPDAGDHPLAREPEMVKRWFSDELDEEERIFLVTAALFNGVEQAELMQTYREILAVVEAENETDGEAEDEEDGEASPGGQKVGASADGRPIRLEISIAPPERQTEVRTDSAKKGLFVDEGRLLALAGLRRVEGKRNAEHGPTPVQLVVFQSAEYQTRILQLLAESYPGFALGLAPALYLLGIYRRAAVRKRAGEAVGDLMCAVDFIRFKEEVVNRWALSGSGLMTSTAGFALARAAEDPRFEDNVKQLINHWVTSSNRSLNWAGVGSCALVGHRWPEDTMAVLKTALSRDWFELEILAGAVIRHLVEESNASLVLDRLSTWVEEDKRSELASGALLVFLGVIEPSDLEEDETMIRQAARLLQLALAGLPGSDLRLLRDAAVDRLEEWARAGLDDEDTRRTVEELLATLYLKAPTPRDRKRIRFYIDRWTRKDSRFEVYATTW